MEITKKLVVLYFKGKTTLTEDGLVEKWLSSDHQNAEKAMQWVNEVETEPEDNELFIEMMLSKNEVWLNTQENIANERSKERTGKRTVISFSEILKNKSYLAVAATAVAATIILVSAFGLVWFNKSGITEISTSYGQIQNVILPDSSAVVLNGNSHLKYNKSWNDTPREIWLEGEAFFDVKHLKTNSSFTVHLSNGKNIEVLGTEFNVIDRNTRSCIVLKSGSIRLSLPDNKKDIYLKPGDLLEINDSNPRKEEIQKVVVNPDTYSSWIKGRWRLEGTSLKEMLQKVEENYGIAVSVENKDLLSKKVSGSVPLSQYHADTLINDIADLFELQLIRKDNKLILAE